MNELKVFDNPTFGQVRSILKDDEPWFVAADVCRALGLEQVSRAMNRLDEDEKGLLKVPHPQSAAKTLDMNGVNEPGLYRLVLCSTKPEAKVFKRWITHEVIPSIRKHGAYMTPEKLQEVLLSPDTLIQLASNLKEEQEKNKRLTAKAEQDAPKVLFADSVACSNSEILVGELAKILKQKGMDIGQNRLFEKLRQDGYLVRRKGSDYNMPTQRSMEMGLMRIKETSITHADGHVSVSRTPKVTGKGQIYFVNKYA